MNYGGAGREVGMTSADRWMVAGAWTVLAVCLAVGHGRISSAPKVEPWILEVEARFREEAKTPSGPTWPRVEKWVPPWSQVVKGGIPGPEYAASIITTPLPLPPITRPTLTVELLPRAAEQRCPKADLDGVVVEWDFESPAVELPEHVVRKPARASALVVEREDGSGWKAIAALDPRSTRHVDLTAEPNRTYRYRVIVKGPEIVLDGRDGVVRRPDSQREPEGAAEARTPAGHRVAILGGDPRVAILRVERYDRTAKAWVSRVVNAKPGEKIGGSGWTLDGLRLAPGRFERPVLAADVTDETGARRELRMTTNQE
jgi:hypothetical protein